MYNLYFLMKMLLQVISNQLIKVCNFLLLTYTLVGENRKHLFQ